MSYSDKQITCSDCGTVFNFTAGEQEQFASEVIRMLPNVVRHAEQKESRPHLEVAVIAAVVWKQQLRDNAAADVPREMRHLW